MLVYILEMLGESILNLMLQTVLEKSTVDLLSRDRINVCYIYLTSS